MLDNYEWKKRPTTFEMYELFQKGSNVPLAKVYEYGLGYAWITETSKGVSSGMGLAFLDEAMDEAEFCLLGGEL